MQWNKKQLCQYTFNVILFVKTWILLKKWPFSPQKLPKKLKLYFYDLSKSLNSLLLVYSVKLFISLKKR